MQHNTKKKIYQEYVNRWQKIKEIEEIELRDASFAHLFKQTLSIWDISRSLGFFITTQPSENIWCMLRKKWIDAHVEE